MLVLVFFVVDVWVGFSFEIPIRIHLAHVFLYFLKILFLEAIPSEILMMLRGLLF